MFHPQFKSSSGSVNTALFSTLQKMYNLEKDNLIKYCYRLYLKALLPSNFERQNVK